MTLPLPELPAFSSVYYGENNDEDEEDVLDFGASSSLFEDVVDDMEDVDTIDNSPSAASAINPVARRILMESDYDTDDTDYDYDNHEINTRKLPLGVPDDTEDEEFSSSEEGSTKRESQHSLPDVEELKLAAAATHKGGGGGVSSMCSYSTRKRIIYPSLLVVMAFAIIVYFTKAIATAPTASSSVNPEGQGQKIPYETDSDIPDSGTPSSSLTDVDRLDHLQNYMIQHGITAVELLEDTDSNASSINTPQAQAIRWLAYEDQQFPLLPSLYQDPSTPEGYSLVSRYAMAVLYFATHGKNWKDSLNFLDPSKDTCDWFTVFPPPKGEVGVLCNQSTRRILGLSMISNNVRGTIPSELSQVTSLEYIESIDNSLSGTIPDEFQKLTALRTLVIAFNELTGTLPSWMPLSWTDMEFLYLSNNALTGTLPENFFEFQKLSVLALDDNILTGKTDVVWNSIPSLEFVYLEDNDFTGTLPNLVSESNAALRILDVSSNRLTGSIPDDVFGLKNLEILDLHDNRFTSTIPETIPEDNGNLKFVALQKNILNGSIPSAIANLKQLFHLDLTRNQLTGLIPNELERLSDSMTYLFLGENNYQEEPIPSFVYALTNLRELSLKSSNRKGSISGVIGALDSMVVLDLDNNRLTGSIPNEIGMMTNLEFLLLNRNQLSSAVPGDEMANLKNLRFLLLDNNHIFGDLNPICSLDLLTSVFVDCGEVTCLEGCCSCCQDGRPCHDSLLISSQDPVWETDYTRQFFDFDPQEGAFSSNRDDDYWQ